MTSLVQYDRLCAALAAATKVDQVMNVQAEIEHIKLFARQVKNQALLAEAIALQMQAERRLGALLLAAKQAGQIDRGGGRRKNPVTGSDAEPVKIRLEEIGVSKKLSMRAQQRAALSEEAFADTVVAARERLAAGKAKIIEADQPINGSRAIMAGRQEPDDSLDFFPTPPFATRALLQHALPHLGVTVTTAWEPAVGEGHISAVLREAGIDVYATDIHDYGTGALDELCDFLADDYESPGPLDWVITNPPFGGKTIGFVKRALEVADVGVAMFVRSQWAVEGIERYEEIFRDTPPTLHAYFVERVPLCKGRWNPDGTTATAYCWLIWIKGKRPRPPFYIPPGCRERLTHATDRARFAAPTEVDAVHDAALKIQALLDAAAADGLTPRQIAALELPPSVIDAALGRLTAAHEIAEVSGRYFASADIDRRAIEHGVTVITDPACAGGAPQ
jgi:hypothetical protein